MARAKELPAPYISPRQRYIQRHAELKTDANQWVSHWRELAQYIQPKTARFLATDANNGKKERSKIINSAPTRAHNILAAGMMAGLSSPSRPWFRLTTPDPTLSERGAVRSWLHRCETTMRSVYARSNIYNGLHGAYKTISQFGVTALHVEEDEETIIRSHLFPVGSFFLATSPLLIVDTIHRELTMTVRQLVSEFGMENVSRNVRELYNRRQHEQRIQVLWSCAPNDDYDPEKRGPRGMKWKSCWLEMNASDSDGFLREKGYHEFPTMAPRWEVTGEDTYGNCPGMEALPDCKTLYLLEKRKAKAFDQTVDPPMGAPTSLENAGRASILPGDVTFYDVAHGGQKFEPLFQVNHGSLREFREEIREVKQQIHGAFYADLFLMLAQQEAGQPITAREVVERHEEKMMQLGPVLERLQGELYDPLIDRTFAVLLRGGYLPPPPPELQGMELRVDYISILAQAQKMLAIGAIERLAGFVANLAAAKPDVLDKLNADEMVDEYADAVGVKPDLVHTDEQVAAIRQQRAQAKAQEQQMAMAAQAAKSAKDLSQTTLDGNNGLNALLNGLGGPVPQVGGGA